MSRMESNTFGILSSAGDGSIVNCIFNYVTNILKVFKGGKNENENGLTNSLCKTLEFKKPSEYPFFFHHQNIENNKTNTSTDFAVFGTYAYVQQNHHTSSQEAPALIKFEAKRLTNKLPKNREKEYVIGEYKLGEITRNSGGLERFKNGRHGKDVVHAGIIGYVQSDSFTYWFDKINNWIEGEIENPHDKSLCWDGGDLLTMIQSENNLSEYFSKPKRKQNDIINIRHLWVNLCWID